MARGQQKRGQPCSWFAKTTRRKVIISNMSALIYKSRQPIWSNEIIGSHNGHGLGQNDEWKMVHVKRLTCLCCMCPRVPEAWVLTRIRYEVSTRSHASKGGSLNIHMNLITVSLMCHADSKSSVTRKPWLSTGSQTLSWTLPDEVIYRIASNKKRVLGLTEHTWEASRLHGNVNRVRVRVKNRMNKSLTPLSSSTTKV